MSAGNGSNSELPSQCDVAIIGAGPIGLMLANLLGLAAGVDVVGHRAQRQLGRIAARHRL